MRRGFSGWWGCTLLTAVTMAADAGLANTAWQLAWALNSFQLRKGYWQNHACLPQAGLGRDPRPSALGQPPPEGLRPRPLAPSPRIASGGLPMTDSGLATSSRGLPWMLTPN